MGFIPALSQEVWKGRRKKGKRYTLYRQARLNAEMDNDTKSMVM